MNQEEPMQDAARGSRVFSLQITGLLNGNDAAAVPGTLCVMGGLVPLSILEMPGQQPLLLTDPAFWLPERMKQEVQEGGTQGTFRWEKLAVGQGDAGVRLCTGTSLTVSARGDAAWQQEEEDCGTTLQALRYLHFREGLLGLPEWKQFLLYYHDAGDPVGVLIPLLPDSVSLAVVDPFKVLPDYQPAWGEVESAELAAGCEDALACLSILNIQNDPFEAHVNLLGPLVYNPRSGRARQVVLSNSGYSASYRLGQFAGLGGEG